MANSIVILKTGEQIICELKEAFEGEGEERKGICLVMVHPYILELVKVDNPADPMQDLQVKFSRWCPYSIDTQFRIPYDVVTAIGVPDSGLEEAYIRKVEAVTVIPPDAIAPPEEVQQIINEEFSQDGDSPTNDQLQQIEVQNAINDVQ